FCCKPDDGTRLESDTRHKGRGACTARLVWNRNNSIRLVFGPCDWEHVMAAEQSKPKGPDLTRGVALDHLGDGAMVGGHVGDEAVLLARRGDEFFAIGATCSHYGGPLAEGLIVGDTVRCPWHHACFSLRTGEAVAAPAFNPMPCWRVEKRNGTLFVREKIQ